jgi:hypothetical protein
LFCPSCLEEYEEGVTRCEGCEVDLVEGEEGEVEYLPLLGVTDGEHFAKVASRLEEAGIAWFVQVDGSPTVYVDRKRLARAQELVGEPAPVLRP